MTRDEIIEMARQARWSGIYSQWVSPTERTHLTVPVTMEQIEVFAKLVAAAEREAITDEFWSCVQSDLENGIKSLNQKATEDFYRTMPELSKFGRWLEARGET